MSKTESAAHAFVLILCIFNIHISNINEGLKFDEQGNKQKALQFYHKGMKTHLKDLLALHTYDL